MSQWSMVFNWQAVQSTLSSICLQWAGIHLPKFLRPFNDGYRYFIRRQLRRQIFAGIFLGSFFGQIALFGLDILKAGILGGVGAFAGLIVRHFWKKYFSKIK